MPILDRLGKPANYLTQQEDIALYLERLLNTRSGTTPQNKRLGLDRLPSLGTQNDPELMDMLALAILEQIKNFEPRLKHPRFIQEDKNLLLLAELTNGKPIQLLFQLDKNLLLKVQSVTPSNREVLSHV